MNEDESAHKWMKVDKTGGKWIKTFAMHASLILFIVTKIVCEDSTGNV